MAWSGWKTALPVFLLSATVSTAVVAAGGMGVNQLVRTAPDIAPAPEAGPYRVVARTPAPIEPDLEVSAAAEVVSSSHVPPAHDEQLPAGVGAPVRESDARGTSSGPPVPPAPREPAPAPAPLPSGSESPGDASAPSPTTQPTPSDQPPADDDDARAKGKGSSVKAAEDSDDDDDDESKRSKLAGNSNAKDNGSAQGSSKDTGSSESDSGKSKGNDK